MDKQYTTVSFNSELSDIHSLNSSFDEGILQIAYHGDNHNKSSIDKDTFERAIPSMFNCPIVCRYFREDDNLGGHDVEIVSNENGMSLINVTQPVGVVPESSQWFWKEVEENDGKIHEYLCTSVLLWKRQEAYSYIKRKGIVGQSMEINVLSSYKRTDGFKVFDSIEFTAFCLLGEGVEPCYESASLELFNKDNMQEQFAQMMDDFKAEFAMVNSASADDEYMNKPKGGNEEMNLNELIEKYGLSAEDVNFSTDGMNADEIEARFAQIKKEKDKDASTFVRTASDTMSAIDEAIAGITYVESRFDEAYELRRYYAVDFDMENNEALVYDCKDALVYGFPFTMNGDRAVIDFECKKRKKCTYVDYDEGDEVQRNPIDAMSNEIFSAYTKLKGEADTLRTFKLNTEKAADDAKRKSDADAVFAKFTALNGNEEFESLKANYGEMSGKEIEEKCFTIMGKVAIANFTANFTLDNGAPSGIRVAAGAYDGMLNSKTNDSEPYGGAFVEFGIGQ